MRWVTGMALKRLGIKGHLRMERKYAQVQVRRGAREPNQRQNEKNREKEKAMKTRVSQHLPLGFTVELDNCYFVPAICMNIISGSCLILDGYSFKSENNGCSIHWKNMFYGFAPVKNGCFI